VNLAAYEFARLGCRGQASGFGIPRGFSMTKSRLPSTERVARPGEPGSVRLAAGKFLGRLERTIDIGIGRLSESRYEPGDVQVSHTHELPHIALTVDGAYEESIAGQSQPVRAGSLTFYQPGVVHSEHHHEKGTHLLLELRPHADDPATPLLKRFGTVRLEPHPATSTAWKLYREVRRPDSFSALSMEALSLELLIECLRRSNTDEGRRPAWLDTVEEILRARLSCPPSLRELAREVGVHPVHLARTFRRFEHASIGEHLRSLRVEFARSRLVSGAEPLSHIALEAGFSDQSHFTRVFKRMTGVTPGRYRKQFRR
jgi:AraC family transcriptional regulator